MAGTMKRGASGYYGVAENEFGKFIARIYLNSKMKYIGTYETPELAARAFDVAAEIYGKSYRNFPQEHENNQETKAP